jgi:hypothetical protein
MYHFMSLLNYQEMIKLSSDSSNVHKTYISYIIMYVDFYAGCIYGFDNINYCRYEISVSLQSN